MEKSKRETAFIVGRTFLRVCKNHNLYYKFKKVFCPNEKILGECVANNGKTCHDIYEMFLINADVASKMQSDMHHHMSQPNDKYEIVVHMVNCLLQFYLEKGCQIDPNRLGELGEQMFNISCYHLYGNEFLEYIQNAPQNNENDFSMFCQAQYARCVSPEQKDLMSFDQFVESYKPQLTKAYEDMKRQRKGGKRRG